MNSNLQNKLSQFEAAPPGDVWDKIAKALDGQQSFPQRLYDYQETPKANIWHKIEASLEETTPAKVIPFTTRYKKSIRYIAAAGTIAMILISSTLLMKRTDDSSIETASAKSFPVNKVAVQNPAATSAMDSNNRIESIASMQNNQENIYQTGTRQKRILGFIRPQNIISAIVLRGRFVPGLVDKEEMFTSAALNDYMVYSDGDGNVMKLPKKLFSLVNCPDGDGSCKERIHQAQQKLSSAAISADFSGMLEMLRQLQ